MSAPHATIAESPRICIIRFCMVKDVKSAVFRQTQILTKISTQKKLIQQIIILIKLFQEQTIIINQPLLVVIVL